MKQQLTVACSFHQFLSASVADTHQSADCTGGDFVNGLDSNPEHCRNLRQQIAGRGLSTLSTAANRPHAGSFEAKAGDAT
jgi:hypothetical protein